LLGIQVLQPEGCVPAQTPGSNGVFHRLAQCNSIPGTLQVARDSGPAA
jgi:hypothetical protein